jgi:hypothetical protein
MISNARTIETVNKEGSLSSVSIFHSILSILPYHMTVEYFALPLSIDSKGKCTRA